MIEVRSDGERLVVERLPAAATHAYVDADWLPAGGSGPAVAVVAAAETLMLPGAPRVDAAPGETDVVVAALLAQLALDAAAAARDAGGSIEVRGGGAIASAVRAVLGASAAVGERPRVIVEPSGSPDAITAALGDLDDLGTLVLPAGGGSEVFGLDLYPDVHVRGLTLVGVPFAAHGSGAVPPPPPLSRFVLRTLRRVRDGDGFDPGGYWYRIEAPQKPADSRKSQAGSEPSSVRPAADRRDDPHGRRHDGTAKPAERRTTVR